VLNQHQGHIVVGQFMGRRLPALPTTALMVGMGRRVVATASFYFLTLKLLETREGSSPGAVARKV
jgi:hypothetical protein